MGRGGGPSTKGSSGRVGTRHCQSCLGSVLLGSCLVVPIMLGSNTACPLANHTKLIKGLTGDFKGSAAVEGLPPSPPLDPPLAAVIWRDPPIQSLGTPASSSSVLGVKGGLRRGHRARHRSSSPSSSFSCLLVDEYVHLHPAEAVQLVAAHELSVAGRATSPCCRRSETGPRPLRCSTFQRRKELSTVCLRIGTRIGSPIRFQVFHQIAYLDFVQKYARTLLPMNIVFHPYSRILIILLVHLGCHEGQGHGHENQPSRCSMVPMISDEIIFEILARLPVKDLMRFKSVSKVWRAMISDPLFIRLHLQQSAKNQKQIPSFLFTSHTLFKVITARPGRAHFPAISPSTRGRRARTTRAFCSR
jgi:hypothetical protein